MSVDGFPLWAESQALAGEHPLTVIKCTAHSPANVRAARMADGSGLDLERIREKANVQRAIVNKEMDIVAKRLEGLVIAFPARASETGKLYGSITTQMIAEAIKSKTGVEVARRQIDAQPLRMLDEYTIPIRLTVDLIPEIKVIVHREGEIVALPAREEAEPAAAADTSAYAAAETAAEA